MQILYSKGPFMRSSTSSPVSRDTEFDKFCNRRKTLYLPSWISVTLQSTSMFQPEVGYQLRNPHQEEESYNLTWWQFTPIPNQSRNAQDYSRISSTPSQRRSQSSTGQNSFFPEKSWISWSCYLRTWTPTSCKKSETPTKSKISWEQKRCNENPWKNWFLWLLYQEYPRR